MRGGHRRARFTVALGALLTASCAFALNPAFGVGQYAHKSWTAGAGDFKGSISAVVQTPDGYLWLGTDFGLLRFDGVRFVPWTPPAGEQLPSEAIQHLLATRDGSLWIATHKGLAQWNGGRLTTYREFAGRSVGKILEDHEGVVWAARFGVTGGSLCAIRKSDVRCDDGFDSNVLSLYEYHGDLWAGTGRALWRSTPHPERYPAPGSQVEVNDLMEGDNGALWIATRDGIRQWTGGKMEPTPFPAGGRINAFRVLRDRDGGEWIGTFGQGLVHLHQQRTDTFAATDGLSGNRVMSIFEDREGDIWVATDEGLDRFRDLTITTISVRQRISNLNGGVVASRDGSIWLATNDGLEQWKNNRMTIYRTPKAGGVRRAAGFASPPDVREIDDSALPDNAFESLFEDDRGRIWVSTPRGIAYLENDRFVPAPSLPFTMVHNIAEEGSGNLWINEQNHGLVHLVDGRVVEQVSWASLGRDDVVSTLAVDPVRRGLWLGFFKGGLAYFSDGRIRLSFAAAQGLGGGRVNDIRIDREGTLWAATEGGLSRLRDGRISTLTGSNGLPCDAVHWTTEDDAGSVWLNQPCGLARVARSAMDAWAAGRGHSVVPKVFDRSDGVKNYPDALGYSPRFARSADGRLWLSMSGGLGVVDPHHLPLNRLPPPVHIEQIIADRKIYAAGAKLPPLVRDVEIDYTALSFVAPERMRFRFKLEGRDKDWHDVGNRRQASYDDLPPRYYRFRVMASNNDGVWNEAGASLDFSVAPAFYQTIWFRALCLFGAGVLTWMLYHLRLRQMSARINLLYKERLAERTRIARDLHDTLLQSLAGVSLQLHGIAKTAASAPEKTPPQIEKIRQQVDATFREARSEVYNLRSPVLEGQGLTDALKDFIERLELTATAQCTLHVTGEPFACTPEIEEELLRIAGEAANNANRHAGAKEIRIALEYSGRSLKLSISDDGCGFRLEDGLAKTGHWGLRNMQERAASIRGRFTICSAPRKGTQIDVHLPLRRWSLRKNIVKRANTNSGGR